MSELSKVFGYRSFVEKASALNPLEHAVGQVAAKHSDAAWRATAAASKPANPRTAEQLSAAIQRHAHAFHEHEAAWGHHNIATDFHGGYEDKYGRYPKGIDTKPNPALVAHHTEQARAHQTQSDEHASLWHQYQDTLNERAFHRDPGLRERVAAEE